jgi:hypothetical protein
MRTALGGALALGAGALFGNQSPKCFNIFLITSESSINEIILIDLKHLGLWGLKQRPPPRANAPSPNIHIDYTDSQIPSYEDDLYYDPDYPIEMYAS